MTSLRHNQSGIAHLMLITLLVIAVGTISFVGYRVFTNNNSSQPQSTETAMEKEAVECFIPDEEVPVQCGEYYNSAAEE